VFGGGYADTSSGNKTTIYRYNTATNTVTTLSAKLPTASHSHCVGVYGSNVYLIHGYLSADQIFVFNSATETVSTLGVATPESNVCYVAYGQIGNKLYLFCGGQGSFYNARDSIRTFEFETNTFTTLNTKLPEACFSQACGVVGKKIYLLGGKTGQSTYTDKIVVYDTENDSIETLPITLPYGVETRGCVVGNKIYLFGGRAQSGYVSDIHVFNTDTMTLKTLSLKLPTARMPSVCCIGTTVFAIGGYSSGTYYSDIYAWDASTDVDVPQDTAYIAASITSKAFPLIVGDNTVTIGANAVYIGDENGAAVEVNANLYNEDSQAWERI
jgi:N-acetylneuraminic acid mutarotase